MKIKNIVIVLSVSLNLVFGFMILFSDLLKEGPTDVALSFQQAVETEDYTAARTFIDDGREKYISNETLQNVNQIKSSATGLTSFTTYELIEFDNGEMVLLNLNSNEQYKILDVRIVPEEVKSFFN